MWDDYGGWYDHVPPPMRRLRRARHPRAADRHLAVREEKATSRTSSTSTAASCRFIEDMFGLPRLAASDKRAQLPGGRLFRLFAAAAHLPPHSDAHREQPTSNANRPTRAPSTTSDARVIVSQRATRHRIASSSGWRGHALALVIPSGAHRPCVILSGARSAPQSRRAERDDVPPDGECVGARPEASQRAQDRARRNRHPGEPELRQPVPRVSRSRHAVVRVHEHRAEGAAQARRPRDDLGYRPQLARVLRSLRRNGKAARHELQDGRFR